MEKMSSGVEGVKLFVNNCFKSKEPWQIASITAGTVLTGVWLWQFIFQEQSLLTRGKKTVFRLARYIPAIRQKIEAEMSKINDSFEEEVISRNRDIPYVTVLPQKGQTHSEIIKKVESHLQSGDYNWKQGFVSGAVYNFDQDLIKLLTQVYGLASYTNPLHPDIFPGVCKMEAEVVRITTNLFHGGPNSCGTMTSGGTESILMACKAYRDYARTQRGIRHPEIVLPVTAHPAFDKAAQYFGMKITYVAVDPVTRQVDLKAMRRAISRNTCMLVGSMPNYPYGTRDDIQAIAALGRRYIIPVHVDACLGGFVVAFMEKAGYKLPPFDFAVEGVTSISADTHKYGFAPKGSSVVMYSEPKYRHHQYCVTTDWPGGVYGSPSINGSRAGGIIAACWATLMYYGLEGYVDATRKIVKTTRYIEAELRNMESLFVFGTPVSSVVAVGSDVFHIYQLSDALGKRGWNLNPLQFPPGIHLCVTYMHTLDGVADKFLADVREVMEAILKDPTKPMEGKFAMYGQSHSIPDRSIVGDFTRFFLDAMYFTPKAKAITG